MNRSYLSRVTSLAVPLAGCLGIAPMLTLAQTPAKPPRPASPMADYERRQNQAIRRVKDFRASRIDDKLPNVFFGLWLEQILGPGLIWEMNDCGEGGGPICVEIDGKSPEVTISLNIGSEERGINGSPVLFFGTIKLFDVDREIRRLSDLRGFIEEARWRATAFRNHPLKEVTDTDAIRIGRSVVVQVLDPLLPREPFEKWLAALMPSATLNWRQDPCEGRNTQPSCVWLVAKWPNGSSALVSLDLESVQRGLSEQPSFSHASFYDRVKGRNDSYRTLVAFAAAVQASAF